MIVYEKNNGNDSAYPVRPYRSRDYLISSEPSALYRSNLPYPDDEAISNRKSIFKDTDVNRHRTYPNETLQTLPIDRNQTLISPSDSQQSNPPLTMQRRSSFQAATQLNNFDFYSNPDSSYLVLEKPFIPSIDRQPPYSNESDRRSHDYYSSFSYLKSTPISPPKNKSKRTSVESSSKYIFNNDDGIFV